MTPQKNISDDICGAVILKIGEKTFHGTPACSIEEKKEMWKNKDQYLNKDWICTVKYFGKSDEGIPRFPVIIGFRHENDC